MDTDTVLIRVGNRSVPASFIPLRVASIHDAPRMRQLVMESVRANTEEPLIITVNGHTSYIDDVLASCVDDRGLSLGITNREVQYSEAVRQPQSTDRRAGKVPWTFVVDQMNLPEVYRWSFGDAVDLHEHTNDLDAYRFRTGAWVCDQGAYRYDSQVPVIIIFTRPNNISENVVQTLIFPHVFKAASLYDDRTADDAVCWVFFQLYTLLSDWQNIITELGRALNQAEMDSRQRDLPIKTRTRRLHREVDHIYALDEHLRFHMRCFRKLAKFKIEIMDDALDDLDQYDNYLDSMKERFNNLIELEFNIENATQSANARFLSILGALFIPISFAASIFGISTVDWPPIYYLYVALPLFFCSLFLVITLPSYMSDGQNNGFPSHIKRIHLRPQDFTLLGNELPVSHETPQSPRDCLSDQSEKSTTSSQGLLAIPIRHHTHPSGLGLGLGKKVGGNSTHTFYGIQRSPGIVGSGRKNLYDEEFRKERMHLRDFEREVDRAAGRAFGKGHRRAAIDLRDWRPEIAARGRKVRTDGAGDLESHGTFTISGGRVNDDDVERLGSLRRRSWSMPT
ncbi:Eukaryotic translation initiation factor 3 subunit I [Sphaceloma murrayae]|uniref:Eukaryotic translation initiation factor 3 subunit I n=1 Tax=Sphaceloma murrayae TaxID=2082308 RepID=A0A2K1QJ37_9PEZI|nr:Eukaryotic translation initiation factor 3 subunit I [Sphaceloma murrayae]